MLLLMNEISKYFGHFKALDNASIDINHGEIVGLVGENGAGKSTLIKILNGAYKYDSGTIKFNDLNWFANSPQHAQRNGIVHFSRNKFKSISINNREYIFR